MWKRRKHDYFIEISTEVQWILESANSGSKRKFRIRLVGAKKSGISLCTPIKLAISNIKVYSTHLYHESGDQEHVQVDNPSNST